MRFIKSKIFVESFLVSQLLSTQLNVMDSSGPSDSKRRRLSQSPPTTSTSIKSNEVTAVEEEDSYTPYVSVKKRRAAFVATVTSKHSNSPLGGGFTSAERQKLDEDEAEREFERINGKVQRGTAQTLLIEAQEVKRLKAIEG